MGSFSVGQNLLDTPQRHAEPVRTIVQLVGHLVDRLVEQEGVEQYGEILTILRDEGGITVIDIKLLKAFTALYGLDNEQFKVAARKYSRLCYEHAVRTVVLDEDKEALKKLVID